MSMPFCPSRLKEARLELGMNQATLATCSGVPRVYISKMENGIIKDPSTETVFALSTALHKPLLFFYPEDTTRLDKSTVPSFRSFSTKAKRDNDYALMRLDRCLLLMQYLFSKIKPRQLLLPFEQIEELDPLSLSDDDIEYMAEEIRRIWHCGSGPILNLCTFLENNGVICFSAVLPDKVDSVNITVRIGDVDMAAVLYNSRLTLFRQRFSLAHELGHIVLHRNASEDDFIDNGSLFETQANRFASAFLLSSQAFVSSIGSLTLNGARNLKPVWKTSIATIIRRFRDLELIDDNRYTYLNVELSRKGWKKAEPGDDVEHCESPYYMNNAFSFLFQNRLATPQDIIAYCQLPLDELIQYAGNESYFHPPVPDNLFEFRVSP